MNRDLDIIMRRIQILFKRMNQTLYRIEVVNDKFDEEFNFFFHIQPKNRRIKSVPLHAVKKYDLEYLEEIINLIKKQTNLSIEFIGFEDLHWQSNHRMIQH
ncbi:hypothetical protein [Pediococcus stilesii]|uniref:hypothetical protein n=1 Tax=Pediococcus stilesii TaxID=331679 RepID=UPI0007104329|nr:hypothetical protein [Pediococcus stilesii]